MSGDSSLGIGIGLALKSYGRAFTYVKTDRALDLGNLEPFTIPDLSGNANTATLYTGIYVSTNGTTDKAIGAGATALGSGNYYLTGKIKPAGTTAKTTMDGSTASNLTGLTAGVWQDFQTATASAITPSSINLGWDGTAFNTTVDNWSDVKLHDASDDSVVAHYKLYDSADASLDGYPALDCVGGYHGAHVGCAGGASEASILQTAGEDFNKRMWFDGVDDEINIGSGDALSLNGAAKIEWRGWIYYNGFAPSGSSANIVTQSIDGVKTGFNLAINTTNSIRIAGRSVAADEFQNLTTTMPIGWGYVKAYIDIANDEIGISINNGAYVTSAATFGNATYTSGTPTGNAYIGNSNAAAGLEFLGIIGESELLIDDVQTEHWAATGNTDADWVSTGSANGTVNGSPSLYHVAESETTAGQDALGNAITNPRPNERVLNLTTGTGYAEIADSASLDLTTAATWELWGNPYFTTATTQRLLVKDDTTDAARPWGIIKSSISTADELRWTSGTSTQKWTGLSDQVSQIVITYNAGTLTLYENGISIGTGTLVGGTIPASLPVTVDPITVGCYLAVGVPSQFTDKQIGDIRIYDRALTADEVLKNYNARKGAYGL